MTSYYSLFSRTKGISVAAGALALALLAPMTSSAMAEPVATEQSSVRVTYAPQLVRAGETIVAPAEGVDENSLIITSGTAENVEGVDITVENFTADLTIKITEAAKLTGGSVTVPITLDVYDLESGETNELKTEIVLVITVDADITKVTYSENPTIARGESGNSTPDIEQEGMMRAPSSSSTM